MSSQRSVRFAHLTDMHIVPENRAPEAWASVLQQVAKLEPVPDFIVTGGDCVGDALERGDRADVERQWDLYLRGLAAHNTLPVYPVMGNHDVWAWMVKGFDESTAGFGKAMALEKLRLDRAYYSFDHGDWHFIVLDNIQRRRDCYFGALDDAQHEWLKQDLAGNDKPVCLFTHIPLLAACAFRPRGFFKEESYRIPDTWLHADVMPLLLLLRQHNVKLCISGHLHMVDRVDFLGMTFICNGSVCGRWWKGPYEEFSEGYGVFDLHADGSFTHQYRTFGWDAVPKI